MNIAYVTTYDAYDIHAWSGLGNYILQTLQNSGHHAETIGRLKRKKPFAFQLKKDIYSKILSKTYLLDREPSLLRHYASQVENALAGINCDVVFSPGSISIAHLKTDKPIVFWTDATFAGMVDFYPEFSNLCSESIRKGNRMEQLALSKCRLAIYSSEWAAKTAIQYYDVDPDKVKVVPFGPNITSNRELSDITKNIECKDMDTCKLLFAGVNWSRKGGDTALEVARLLNKRGIKTELHVVGCNPEGILPDFVIQHGFISKKNEDGLRLFDTLMSESHFLILPSKAECFGVVFSEASSYGLPSISTRVGGIPTAINDGINGRTFALDTPPNEYCDYIAGLMTSKQRYRDLALSSYNEYKERLNWSSIGKRVSDLLEEYCG